MGHSIDLSCPAARAAERSLASRVSTRLCWHQGARWPSTQRGGCDCGAVRYELQIERCLDDVELPVGEPLVRAREFRLLSGEEFVSGHQFASCNVHYFYCERCGVCSFRRHNVEREGAAFYAVNVACLDR